MSDKDEVMQQALEALEADELDMVDDGSGNMVFRKEQAIAALRTALEQQAEPVAMQEKSCARCLHKPTWPNTSGVCGGCRFYSNFRATPPLPVQPEPLEYWNAVEGWVKIDEVREHFNAVNCGTIYKHGGEGRVPLYTAPPQREWVGLTVTTIFNMMPSTIPADYDGELMEFARAVEAKLKELNK